MSINNFVNGVPAMDNISARARSIVVSMLDITRLAVP
jgi:hypothetical protein